MAVAGASYGASVWFSVWRSFGDLWAEACGQRIAVVAVDMPIGLPDIERRTAEVEARALLGPRRSSLFWTPPLCVLDADDHAEANRGSRSALGLRPRHLMSWRRITLAGARASTRREV